MAEPAKLRPAVLDTASAAGTAGWPAPLDLRELADREPQPPQFIVPDWLPIGYATGLFGHGGAGKSTIAMHLSVCIAAGMPFFGLEVQRRRVLYLSCEDREGVIHWRLDRISRHERIGLQSMHGWLEVLDLVGLDTILWERDPKTGFTVTAATARLGERIRESQAEVLVVDGVSDTFGGGENTRGDVKRYINTLVGLIPADRGAVLLVGHISKPTAAIAGTTEGYSGSTSWHNSVRARWYLYPETQQGDESARPERTGELLLELQKSNLGRTDQSMRFKWDAEAHLFVGEVVGGSRFDRKHLDREEQLGILRAMKAIADVGNYVPSALTGPRTAYLVLSQRPEFPASLKGGGRAKTRRFWQQIEALRHMLHIEEASMQRKHRHRTAALILTAEGCAQCA